VEPNFLPASTIAALGVDARQRDAAGEFHAAGIGRDAHQIQSTIRGDRIAWLEEADASPAAQAAWQGLSDMRLALKERADAQALAVQAGQYAPHGHPKPIATYRDDDARVLSFVLYLNDGWRASDGGSLRIHFDDGERRDVLPIGGTLVCFSASHEVCRRHANGSR
jgi:SM-20-related protein